MRHTKGRQTERGTRAGRQHHRRTLSVRVRILTAVLVTTALGMLAAGGISYLIARDNTYEDIRAALLKEADEIQEVAKLARDGRANRPITKPGDVLYLAIRSSLPDPGEAILGIVDSKVELVPGADVPSQRSIEADPELLAAAAAVKPTDTIRIHQISTAAHPKLAFISVPVQVEGSPQLGHYVAAVDVAEIFAPVNRTHLTYAAISIVALLAIGVVGYQVAGRLLKPLRSLRQTAQRISDADLSERIPEEQLSSRDEVADLGHTMNAMLDRLSLSFDNQRQLLDDAGHELRTPITIVRGHLELMDPLDPADVRESREVAIDELDRMQRLVDDLMMLAKSRRPDFVRTEPVVVSDLMVRVLDKIVMLGERHWTIESTTDEVVPLDDQRITQALVQLVANAVRFTQPGAVIALGARIVGPDLRLWVRDEGVGISPDVQDRIFDRFARGDQHVASGDTGSGLGLAIVAAIADAHHGRVSVTSVPGRGATFQLHLPHPDLVHQDPVPTSPTTHREDLEWQPS